MAPKTTRKKRSDSKYLTEQAKKAAKAVRDSKRHKANHEAKKEFLIMYVLRGLSFLA